MAGIAGEPEIAPLDLVMTVDAGVPLATARAAARDRGVDLALEDPPSGPCTVGGLWRGVRDAVPNACGHKAVAWMDVVLLKEGWFDAARVVKNVALTRTASSSDRWDPGRSPGST
jgi:FAD/FMN-containing dehydrogenase